MEKRVNITNKTIGNHKAINNIIRKKAFPPL